MALRAAILLITLTAPAFSGSVLSPLAAQENGAGGPQQAHASADKQLVYADFENPVDGRPFSARGGRVTLHGYQENPTFPPAIKGHEADNSIPKLVRTSKDSANHAAAFDYELVIPNQWAGVTMEIEGHAEADGVLGADDVRGYKFLSIQAYLTGSEYLRVEVKSHGRGINLHSGYPVTGFRLKEGFNTYKVRLSSFSQPDWVKDTRIDPKEVLKELTSIAISVVCDECRPTKGMAVIDNIVFEK